MKRVLRALAALGMTAGLIGVPIGPARASATICVGIVVDYGVAKPGGGANSLCVRVPTGANGADVLAARARALGRPAPTYRSDGLLCTIDGYPSDGSCASTAGGFYRYWGYYHQFPGSSAWVYSQAGPTSFTVSAGSVEGWSYQNGEKPPGRAPAAAGYGSICPASASPTPKATATPRPAASSSAPASSAPASSAPASSAPPGSARPPSAPPSSAPATGRSSTLAGAGPARTTPPPTTARTSTTAPAASASRTPAVTALSPIKPTRGSPSRAPIATLAGITIAGGIATAALLRTRRSRRAGGG